MFFSRKHDLMDMEYKEFKDLLYLPITWFSKVYEQNKSLKYPGNSFMEPNIFDKKFWLTILKALLWDYMIRSGASQLHPHGIFFLILNL